MTVEKETKTNDTFVKRPPGWRKQWLTPSVATIEVYQREMQEPPRLADSKAQVFRRRISPITNNELVWGSVGRVVKELEIADDRLQEHDRATPSITALQIGKPLRLALLHFDDERYVFANPQISDQNGHQTHHVSCLSLPDMAGEVTCPERIRFRASQLRTDAAGSTEVVQFDEQLTGTNVITAMHAQDHLTGTLFTRHVTQQHHEALQVPPVGVCGVYELPDFGDNYVPKFPKDQLVAFSVGEISLGDCLAHS